MNQKSPGRFKFTLKDNYNFNFYIIVKKTGALAAPGLKRPKPTKKNPEKHPENLPEMPVSQGRHTSNDGGSHSRATARTTPSNSPPQQERANTTL